MGAASSRETFFKFYQKDMKPLKGSKYLRKGRVSIINQFYLLTTVVHERKPIFTQPETVEIVLSSLDWLENNRKMILEAAVVMPDHLHFVAQLRSGTLAELMHSLKSFSANKINSVLNRHGPLWQVQYYDHAIRSEEALNDIITYCLNNPVRSGFVADFHEYPYWYCRRRHCRSFQFS